MEHDRRNPGYSSVMPPPVRPGLPPSPGTHLGWALTVSRGPMGVRATVTEHWARRLPDRLVPDQSGLRRRVSGPVETRTVEVGGIEVPRDDCGARWCALLAAVSGISAVLEGSHPEGHEHALVDPQGMYDVAETMDPLF